MLLEAGGLDIKFKKQVEHKRKKSVSVDEEDDGVSNKSGGARDGDSARKRKKKDREREIFKSSGKSLVRFVHSFALCLICLEYKCHQRREGR